MECYGKFVSVKTYYAPEAWRNPELGKTVADLKQKDIHYSDLKLLHSLGVLSIETTRDIVVTAPRKAHG